MSYKAFTLSFPSISSKLFFNNLVLSAKALANSLALFICLGLWDKNNLKISQLKKDYKDLTYSEYKYKVHVSDVYKEFIVNHNK